MDEEMNDILTAQLKKYADLAIRVGVNLQQGQNLVIGFGSRQVLPQHIEFARLLTESAYDAGAKFVQVDWGDEWWLRETVRRGSLETLALRAKWQVAWVEQLAKEGAAYIAIPATDPDLYKDVDMARVEAASRAIAQAFRPFNDQRTNGAYSWALVSAPTIEWANKVYADLLPEERYDALWQGILACSRADGENPIQDWKRHLENLKKRSEWLNHQKIRALHYRAPGTDLTIEMPAEHFWTSAAQATPEGVTFVANIPTEEVYSVPLKTGVHGTVASTLPLNHNGQLIEGIQLRFEAGRIVEYTATRGRDVLKSIIEADEGSRYLGEVALVPVDSPIAKMNRLFYNTLFDENASCHLAIGKAYPLVAGGRDLPAEDWSKHGLNQSLMHVDFMIGSDQLMIEATTQQNEMVSIMKQGRWSTIV